MKKSNEKILTIDISSNSIKIGLVSDELELEDFETRIHTIINEDIDGFAKRFDMDDMWNSITTCIKNVIERNNPKELNIIGISSCAQRMATVFLDKRGKEIYGGPNIDVRGIDSAYLIEDKFTEEDLFKITGHSPSILFCLSRLLWYQEEEEELYDKIGKVLMLDDWITYRLTGKLVSDFTSASDTQLFNVTKAKWSSEIIEAFDFDPDLFPDIVDPGTIVDDLRKDLKNQFGLRGTHIPVIKTGGDTQATLVGMGAIEDNDIGISLGTTAPAHLVVNKPILDPNCNHWLMHHSIRGKWLIEANSGNTGKVYDWFKECFMKDSLENADRTIEKYVKNVIPGADSTYAFLGPEVMNIKDQTSIKKGVFVFQAPTIVSEDLPTIENFAKAVIENICFGIYGNHQILENFAKSDTNTYCAGGSAKSSGFCEILANVLNTTLSVPKCRDSAFIGMAMNTLVGLKRYNNYERIIKEVLSFDKFLGDEEMTEKYKKIYLEWKGLKKTLDEL